MSTVAKRYARAGVDAAFERAGEAAVDALATGLKGFIDSYDGSTELRELIANPVFKGERSGALRAVLEKSGLRDEVFSLVLTLAGNDRMDEIHDVVREVEEIADEQMGRLRAVVQTVVDLTDDQKSRLAQVLKSRLNREVVIEVQVEPSLMGGLVCRVGDMAFDSSLKRQLELIREQLQSSAH